MTPRKLYRVWVTTSPEALLELEHELPGYPSLAPRVCWTFALAGHDPVDVYGRRDELTASGRYTATKLEVVEILDKKGARQ
jgi:hypothetical protein